MVDCLQQAQLDNFLHARLSEAESEEIAAHLEHCAACQTLLDRACDAPELDEYRHAAQGESAFALPPGDVERLRHLVAAAGNAVTSSDDVQSLIRIAGERSSATDATELYPQGERAAASAPPDGEREPPPPPFSKLGNYDVLSRIGKGGMGEVYEAFHPKLRRRVAIKVLSPKRFHDPDAVQRFYREMESIGRLNHPHIVQAHDAGEVGSTLYLVMELVDGCDAALLGQTKGRLPVAAACEIARQTALALQHAHEHHLVHRDVKPSNILISGDVVKLADLGLAKFQRGEASPLTASGLIVGTPDYMSPEQAEGGGLIDIRSDIYSLGCTLYCLLAGRPPFGTPRHDSNLKKLLAHSREPVPPLSGKRSDIPPALWQVLLKMLAKEAGDRFATPQEAVAALQPFAAGHRLADLTADVRTRRSAEPTSTGAPSSASMSKVATVRLFSPSRLRSPFGMDRESRPMAIIAAMVLVLVAGGGYAWWKSSRTSEAIALPSTAPQVESTAGGESGRAVPAVDVAPVEPRRDSPLRPVVAVPFKGPVPKPAYHDQWLKAMQHEPVEILWTNEVTRGTWSLDDGLQALIISATSPKFVRLGQIGDEDCTIGFDVDFKSLHGLVGLFFSCREVEEHDRTDFAMQLLEIEWVNLPAEADYLQLRRRRALLKTDVSALVTGGELRAHRPPEAHSRLEVDVRQQRIVAVRWQQAECPELVAETPLGQFEEASGAWGVFSQNATVWFSEPKKVPLQLKPSPSP